MPGMNGKGPSGKGPLTGGQRGVCIKNGIDKTNLPEGTTADAAPLQGQGMGRCRGGAGRGDGKGQGRGQGRSGNR